ncbi:UDP-N-acetylglucosamine 1-carboxyvinyltransferase [subsurface metagenome]
MDRLVIRGGNKLAGEIALSGAKNSALNILSAAIMVDGEVKLHNVPVQTEDLQTKIEMLKTLGAEVRAKGDSLSVNASSLSSWNLQVSEGKGTRTSILLLGSLLSRFGRARVPLPKGDALGERKHDLHIYALEQLGAKIKEVNEGFIEAECPKLIGNEIKLSFPSTGATEHVMLASCVAEGTTVIVNAAKVPEVVALADFLNSVGAQIRGAGTDTIVVDGVKRLKGTEFVLIPDRMEAGTYMVAGAITHGEVLLTNARFDHLASLIAKLREAGVSVTKVDDGIWVRTSGSFRPTNIVTEVYPGFPTDMQPLLTSLLALADGQSTVKEMIYQDRFRYVTELRKMGAKIEVAGNTIVINGVKRLKGTEVIATDIRAGAALVVAGLYAEGETIIDNVYQIDRGYERIEEKLGSLGAQIHRVRE